MGVHTYDCVQLYSTLYCSYSRHPYMITFWSICRYAKTCQLVLWALLWGRNTNTYTIKIQIQTWIQIQYIHNENTNTNTNTNTNLLIGGENNHFCTDIQNKILAFAIWIEVGWEFVNVGSRWSRGRLDYFKEFHFQRFLHPRSNLQTCIELISLG